MRQNGATVRLFDHVSSKHITAVRRISWDIVLKSMTPMSNIDIVYIIRIISPMLITLVDFPMLQSTAC